MDKCDEKVENWRNITEWLEEAGYKTQLYNQFQLSDDLPLDVSVKRANISFDNNKIIVDINLRIVAATPSEDPIIEDFNTNGKG